MPIPTGTVTGKAQAPGGAAYGSAYSVQFIPSCGVVLDSTSQIVISGSRTVPLAADGSFSAVLPATDSAQLNPTGFTYYVSEQWPGGRKDMYSITVPAGTTRDLAAISPVPGSNGAPTGNFDASLIASGTLAAARIPDLSNEYLPITTPEKYGAIGNGVADDTAAINTYLATAGLTSARLRPGKNYLISAPLVVKSGQTLDASGATITLAAGSNCNMLTNAGVTAQRSVADGAITIGTNTLTSATAAFTSADTGRTAVIAGALLGGYSLTATMTYVNATTVTLSLNAGVTVSAASVSIYTRDTNIRIVGGTWVIGSNAGSGVNLHGLRFRHVDGLVVRDLKITQTVGKYAINPADCTNFIIDNCTFAVASACVQLNGNCSNFTVRNLYGTSGDDSFAITPNDYTAYNDSVGDVVDGIVDNLFVVSGSRQMNLLGGSPGTAMKRIKIRNVNGACTGTQPGVIVGDDPAQASTVGGRIDDIVIENLSTKVVAGQNLVKLTGTNTGKVRFRGIAFDDAANTTAVFNIAAASGTMASVLIEDLNVLNTGSAQIVFINSTTTVTYLLIDRFIVSAGAGAGNASLLQPSTVIADCAIRSGQYVPNASGYLVTFGGTGGVTRLTVSDCHMTAGGGWLQATANTTSLPNVEMSNCISTSTAWLVDLNTTTELHLHGVTLKSPSQGIANLRANSVVTFAGDGNALAVGGNGVKVTAGGKGIVRGWDIPPSATAGGFPTIAAGAGAGTGPTVTVAGSDRAGTVTVVVGTTPAAGVLATITFVGTWPQAPKVAVTPTLTAASQAAGAYVSAKTTTTFVISCANVPGGTVTFDYVVAD